MKRPFLVLLALSATVAFGTWLVRTPHSLRETIMACAGWVLGFWVASAINSRRRLPRTEEPEEDEWEQESEEEMGDESEDDWDEEWGEEDHV